MFKLRAIKSDETYAIVAYDDSIQEHYFLNDGDARGFATHISWVLAEKGNSFWVGTSYGVEKPESSKGIYAVTFRVTDGFAKSYILNKRKLTELKNSLMGVLNG
tara:strand:+ start:54038 stop:54349 length:312 start_codon:yes stop_codon:yes gene_type:complete